MIERIWTEYSCAEGSAAKVEILKQTANGCWGVEIRDDAGDRVLIALKRDRIEMLCRSVLLIIENEKEKEGSEPEGCEPYERSEKDAMWERGD